MCPLLQCISKAQKLIDSIPEGSRENSTIGYNINVGGSFGGRIGAGFSRYVTRDYKNDKVTAFHTLDGATIIKKEELTFYEYKKKCHPRGVKNGY